MSSLKTSDLNGSNTVQELGPNMAILDVRNISRAGGKTQGRVKIIDSK